MEAKPVFERFGHRIELRNQPDQETEPWDFLEQDGTKSRISLNQIEQLFEKANLNLKE